MFCYIAYTGFPSNDLPYQRGVRYTYRYTSTITTTLHGFNSGRNGLALDTVVDIDVVSKCHLMMQVSKNTIVLIKEMYCKKCMMSLILCMYACPTDKKSTD